MSQVSDELLLAYLDGQLDTPQAQSVERMIGTSEGLRARVNQLKAAQSYLIQTFETLARRTRAGTRPAQPAAGQNPAPPGAEKATQQRHDAVRAADQISLSTDGREPRMTAGKRRSMARILLWTGMLSVLAAIIGYGAGKWVRVNGNPAVEKIDARVPAPANRWAEDVAWLHSHFTTASVAAKPESQTNRDLVELQLSRIINRPLKVPVFAEHDLEFRRGQVLSYRGSRMMQLSYAGRDTGLVSLYVMAGGPEGGLSALSQGDVSTVNWSEAGVRYVLAGPLPENSLRGLAGVAMAQMKAAR